MCHQTISTVFKIITAKGNGIICVVRNRDKYICQGLTGTEVEGKKQSITIKYDRLFRHFQKRKVRHSLIKNAAFLCQPNHIFIKIT